MSWFPKIIGLPLLGKELVEQAARRRTYLVRVAYAALLFLAFALYFYEQVPRHGNPYQALGIGRKMFEFLVGIQFAGIYIFLPAMMSGVLTYEKERRSLELVLLTDLQPWEILLQKFAGRLIPMFTFLLLSLPLMAIAYAFGGITTDYLCSGVFLLVLTCFQVGTFALMMSAFCRTSVQAFLGSYAVGALFYLGLPLVYLLAALGRSRSYGWPDEILFAFVPPYIFADTGGDSFAIVAARSIPVMVSTGVFLLMARAFLVRRAFVPAKSLTLGLFRVLDRFMNRANRVVGNIMLTREKKSLPGDEPIAWREVAKRSLGKARYRFRILFVTEVPVVFIAVAVLTRAGRTTSSETLSVMVFVLWALSALAVSVPSANAIASERMNRTLDVLLTTPLAGEDIIRQKTRAVWRLILVLMIPFFTLFLIEAWWDSGRSSSRDLGPIGYLVTSGLTVLIYLPMLSWVSRWVGLKIRTRSRAIIATLGAIVAWNLAPLALVAGACVLTGTSPERSGLAFLFLLGPATVIPLTEFGNGDDVFREVFHAPAAVPIFLNFLWHGGVLYYFRHLCLKHADRYLGRVGERRAKRGAFDWLRGMGLAR